MFGLDSAELGRAVQARTLWCCGAVVLWCCGAVVLWCCGAAVLRCCGAAVLRCCGAAVLRCCGAVLEAVIAGAVLRTTPARRSRAAMTG